MVVLWLFNPVKAKSSEMKKITELSGKLIWVVLLVVVSLSSEATPRCEVEDYGLEDTGYSITGDRLKLLTQNLTLPENRKISLKERERRVRATISKFRSDLSEEDIQKLTTAIVKSAQVVGVDYSILAAVVKKESLFCKMKLNRKGGDSGCMQFTSPGLAEIKDQFGVSSQRSQVKSVEEILAVFAKFYLPTSRRVVLDNWLRETISEQKRQLRVGGFGKDDIYDLDIFVGAILIKINLAMNKGSYILALRNYNGSATKFAYQKDVDQFASKIGYSLIDCSQEAELLIDACKISEGINCGVENLSNRGA